MAEKKRTEADWEDIRVFLALARHGSLSAAARTLSVNHATISRRIRSLEASLGDKLVERRPEGYVLTPAGTRTLSAAREMEKAVQTLGRGELDDAPKGLVRINASPALSQGFLISRLAKLPLLHPGIDIDLATDLRSISLDRHEADIAIRLDPPPVADLIAKRLGSMAYGFYGVPSVCQRVEDGEAPVFVGFDESNADIPDARWLTREYPHARVAFRANNQIAQASAARSGVGLALLPHYIGRKEPDLRLCQITPVPPPREIWLLIREQDRNDLPVRTVVEHLMRAFADEERLFAA